MKYVLVAVVLAVAASSAPGQSLYRRALPAAPPGVDPAMESAAILSAYSTVLIRPAQPRSFKVHDILTIIIDESSRQQAEQSLKTDKKFDATAGITAAVDPWQLLEARLRQGELSGVDLIGANSNNKFNGKGTYIRNDRFTAKVTAEIIDVKPNGTLVIEARKFIQKDAEKQTFLIAGRCRREDITSGNTVLSSQLADLTLSVSNEGQVRDSSSKGLIPRVLETLFAF